MNMTQNPGRFTHLDPDEQAAIRTLIDSILLRHQARKLAS